MVEISLSGSGEGPGGVSPRGYSTDAAPRGREVSSISGGVYEYPLRSKAWPPPVSECRTEER